MGRKRLVKLEDDVEEGTILTVEAFNERLQKINRAYHRDEWLWVKSMYKEVLGVDLENLTKEDIITAADELLRIKSKFLNLIIADAQKEFSELSRCGFGQDGNDTDIETDFYQIRGLYDKNKFVKEMKSSIEKLKARIECFEKNISNL